MKVEGARADGTRAVWTPCHGIERHSVRTRAHTADVAACGALVEIPTRLALTYFIAIGPAGAPSVPLPSTLLVS